MYLCMPLKCARKLQNQHLCTYASIQTIPLWLGRNSNDNDAAHFEAATSCRALQQPATTYAILPATSMRSPTASACLPATLPRSLTTSNNVRALVGNLAALSHDVRTF